MHKPKMVFMIDDDTRKRVGLRLWWIDSFGRHRYGGEIRWRLEALYEDIYNDKGKG